MSLGCSYFLTVVRPKLISRFIQDLKPATEIISLFSHSQTCSRVDVSIWLWACVQATCAGCTPPFAQ